MTDATDYKEDNYPVYYPVENGCAIWAWAMWTIKGKEITHQKLRGIAIYKCEPSETVIFGQNRRYWEKHKEEWLYICDQINMQSGWEFAGEEESGASPEYFSTYDVQIQSNWSHFAKQYTQVSRDKVTAIEEILSGHEKEDENGHAIHS